MIKKILCWLGFHEWEDICISCQMTHLNNKKVLPCVIDNNNCCYECGMSGYYFKCKHCGRIKK